MAVRINTRTSPVDRSLALLRADGCIVDIAERKQGPISRDWLGAFDIVGVTRDGRLIAVQVTSNNGGNFAARVAKVRACPDLPELLRRGATVEVHGWMVGKPSPRIEQVESAKRHDTKRRDAKRGEERRSETKPASYVAGTNTTNRNE